MSRSAGRSHAWLPKKKGEPGEPFLPKVGELYRINTIIFTLGNDPAAAGRPSSSRYRRPGVAIPDPGGHPNLTRGYPAFSTPPTARSTWTLTACSRT